MGRYSFGDRHRSPHVHKFMVFYHNRLNNVRCVSTSLQLYKGTSSTVMLGFVHIGVGSRRRVAIKYTRDVAQGFQEYQTMRRISSHPHVMSPLSMITVGMSVFGIVMDQMATTLGRFVNKFGKLSREVFYYYFAQVAEALRHIHHLDIVHGDIKPENILLTSDLLTTKLADFGSVPTNSRSTGGTAGFVPPELIRSKAGDIYSLGLTMIYCFGPPDRGLKTLIMSMIDSVPSRRPTAERVAQFCSEVLSVINHQA